MSLKKNEVQNTVWIALHTGALTVGIVLVLLIPSAMLISRGTVGMDRLGLLVYANAILAGVLASLIKKSKRGMRILTEVLSALFAGCLLLVIAAELPGERFRIAPIILTSTAFAAGLVIGRIMQCYKKEFKKRKKRR